MLRSSSACAVSDEFLEAIRASRPLTDDSAAAAENLLAQVQAVISTWNETGLGATDAEPNHARLLSDQNGLVARSERQAATVRQAASPGKSAAPDDTIMPCRRFGAYELLEELGRGGMGIVYKARQLKPGRIVALKMILLDRLASAAALQRFETEAGMAAALDHPYIVPIFEIGEHEGQPFYSMGFVEGRSLFEQFKEQPVAPREAVRLVEQVALAIHYAHSRGIVHRDLKPQNILVESDGSPRVVDFGVAKHLLGPSQLTVTGQVLGTPSYMSPEQCEGIWTASAHFLTSIRSAASCIGC